MSAPAAPTGFAAVLSKLNAALGGSAQDPSNTALMGFAAGLGQAATPHMLTPVSGGQALSMGAQASQAYQQRALANQLQQTALIPYQKARAQIATNVAKGDMYQLTPAEQAAVASGKFTPQILSKLSGLETQLKVLGVNTDSIPIFREAETWAKNNVTPYGQPSNTRTVSAAGAATGGAPPAQGPLPTGTAQGPGGAIARLPGAIPAIEANSGAQAAGTFPYQSALKRTVIMQGPVTNRILSLAPAAPPLFNPGLPGAQPTAPSPAALAAAQGAARQRQIGAMNGVQAAGAQLPGAPPIAPNAPGAPMRAPQMAVPPPAAAAPQGASGAPPAIPVTIAPGMSPAQVALQAGAAKQTLADETAASKETEQANTQLARIAQMQAELTQIPVGGNAGKLYGDLGNFLTTFGIKLPGTAAIQEFTKGRVNFVADAARSMGAGISFNEVGFLTKGIPDFTMAGNAPRVLLSQLQGAAQYKQASIQALKFYEQSVPNPYGKPYQGTDRGFEQWWQKTGVTPGAFMFLSTLQTLAPAERAQYLSHFQRNATGRMYLGQYRKAQAFLKQNPGLVPFWTQAAQ